MSITFLIKRAPSRRCTYIKRYQSSLSLVFPFSECSFHFPLRCIAGFEMHFVRSFLHYIRSGLQCSSCDGITCGKSCTQDKERPGSLVSCRVGTSVEGPINYFSSWQYVDGLQPRNEFGKQGGKIKNQKHELCYSLVFVGDEGNIRQSCCRPVISNWRLI